MCSRSITSCSIVLGGICAVLALFAVGGGTSDGGWVIENRRFFRNLDDLKDAFQKYNVPLQTQEIAVADRKYVFVTAAPYSGMDSIDLYCYQYTGLNWSLYTVTFLTHSKSRRIDLRETRGAVE